MRMPEPEIILNCNDNEAARYATTRILQRAGFKVIEAATGREALALAGQHVPPLVILDVNLPDVSGIEVCRQLKSDARTASTLVLQMSATNIAVQDRVQSLAAGADSFLVEPVEPEELEAVTRALLRLHRSEGALRRALVERDLLIKEVNHRVKNSLQLVLSMLSLQAQRFKDAQMREVFTKAVARVTAIAAIHERLYQDQDPLTVDMQSYLSGLGAELTRAGLDDETACTLKLDIQPLRLPTEQGIAVALIMNELVMNSFKHARDPDGPTIIEVHLTKDVQNARLTVSDSGEGKGSAQDGPAGLGMHLIKMLARQLKGEIRTRKAPGQYAVEITFPV